MNPADKHQISIIEDNRSLAETIRKIIDSTEDLFCAGVWSNAEIALKKIDAFRPRIVLMDINLPGMSGIEATSRLKQRFPEMQVIIVTVYGDHDKIFAALKAGASGYLLKRSSPAEVRNAIYDVLAGGAPMSPEIARRVVETFHEPASGEPTPQFDLSKRETEVIELVSEGLSNQEIADQMGIAFDTVRTHLQKIYQKLHVRSRMQAALKFQNSGRLKPKS
ncbi:MAG: response regulator transcription factor [Luteolibacter sp.]